VRVEVCRTRSTPGHARDDGDDGDEEEEEDHAPLVAMKAETVHSLYFSTPRRYLRSVSAGL
jgi:hypothetical protein